VDQVMTVREVALYLQVHPTTIYRLSSTNNLPSFRVGGTWRFSLREVEKWMRQSSGLDKS
jgi:excisionase family DNA binding protein